MACFRFAMKRLLSSTATTTRSSSAVVVPPFRHPSLTNYYNFNTNARRGFFSDMFNRFSSPSAAEAEEHEIPNTSLIATFSNLIRKRETRDISSHQMLDLSVDTFLFFVCYHHPDMIKYAICLVLLKGFITSKISKSQYNFRIDSLKVLDAHHHDDQNVLEAPRFKCSHKLEITKNNGFHVYLRLNGHGNQDPSVYIYNDKLVVSCNLRSPSAKEIKEFIDLPRYIFDHYDPYKFTSHVLEGGQLKFSFPNAEEPVVKPVPFLLKLS